MLSQVQVPRCALPVLHPHEQSRRWNDWMMASTNVDLVRSIFATWERRLQLGRVGPPRGRARDRCRRRGDRERHSAVTKKKEPLRGHHGWQGFGGRREFTTLTLNRSNYAPVFLT